MLLTISVILICIGTKNKRRLERKYSTVTMAMARGSMLSYESLSANHTFEEVFDKMVEDGWIESDEQNAERTRTPREIKRSFLNLVEEVGSGQFGKFELNQATRLHCHTMHVYHSFLKRMYALVFPPRVSDLVTMLTCFND